jgi:hypothetical protein
VLLETRRAELVETEMRPCSIEIKMHSALSVLLQYTLWRGDYIGKIMIVYPLNLLIRLLDLQEVGCGSMEWIEVAQERDKWRPLVKAVMNTSDSIKCREFLD